VIRRVRRSRSRGSARSVVTAGPRRSHLYISTRIHGRIATRGGDPLQIKRMSLEIPTDLWLRWKVQAAKEGVSMKDLVVRLLSAYLDRKEGKK
jgi:hypothetical protein